MAMPDRKGIARTVVIVGQSRRFHHGLTHAHVLIDGGALIGRLDAATQRARAREQ